ncbi:MAG: hypothetical protein LUQ59_04185, partial [Methanothrix sp.]|nr:hypothetical protein [Methanothrix sp.]
MFALATTSIANGSVQGDQDGDNLISQSELQNAENLFKNGGMTADQLADIEHIYKNYPRTFVDAINRTISIYKPLKRIVVLGSFTPEALSILNASDKIVGVDVGISGLDELYPEVS